MMFTYIIYSQTHLVMFTYSQKFSYINYIHKRTLYMMFTYSQRLSYIFTNTPHDVHLFTKVILYNIFDLHSRLHRRLCHRPPDPISLRPRNPIWCVGWTAGSAGRCCLRCRSSKLDNVGSSSWKRRTAKMNWNMIRRNEACLDGSGTCVLDGAALGMEGGRKERRMFMLK